jgi:prepilin-type N-terminal cleavage/methylation domain-containing protein
MKSPTMRAGLTLIEVLLCIAIISVIVALALPGVQSAREASRKTACSNHLRQLALGIHQFHNTHRRLPSNGWGFRWLGEPGRGTGAEQPGGWAFQLLPFIEQGQIVASLQGVAGPERADRLAEMASIPVEIFRCPSRPGNARQPLAADIDYYNAPNVAFSNRTDYAINEGDWVSDSGPGPRSAGRRDVRSYRWIDADKVTGVSWERGSCRLAEITDGTSSTYLVGEKRVSLLGYGTSVDNGHDQSLLSGVDIDTTRWTHLPPAADSRRLEPLERRFGAAHQSGFHISMCDGSVQFLSYSIDGAVHRDRGTRR